MEGYSSSSYYETTGTGTPEDAGLALAVLGIIFLVLIVVYVIHSIFLGKVFKKAGVESWKAWVPIYNNWVILELGGQQGWIALLTLVPGASIVTAVFTCIAMYHIGLKLQKEGWFVLLAIFVPTVWIIWLAVDKSTWQGAGGTSAQPPAVPPTTPQQVV